MEGWWLLHERLCKIPVMAVSICGCRAGGIQGYTACYLACKGTEEDLRVDLVVSQNLDDNDDRRPTIHIPSLITF
jgi:hypothetical protein